MNRNLSIDSAVLLTSLTALLYTWSTAFYSGYLSYIGLDADMMERSFHQVIYNGLLISFYPIILILIVSTISLYLYSQIILPIYIDLIRQSIKSKRKTIKFRRFLLGKRNTPPIELRAKALFIKVAILTFFGVLYIFSLAHFDNNGRDKAKEIVETLQAGETKSTKMLKIELNKKPKTLRFLACGARNCAGMEGVTNLLYYFPSSSSYSFLYKEPSVPKVSN